MKKQSLVQVIKELPREFNLDDLMEKLVVLEKIEMGLNDVRNGRTVSHEKVKKEVKKWLK
jgi:predicted transcriptional regulator